MINTLKLTYQSDVNYLFILTNTESTDKRNNSIITAALVNSIAILVLLTLNLVLSWKCYSCCQKSRFIMKPIEEARKFKYSRCFLKERNFLQSIEQEVSHFLNLANLVDEFSYSSLWEVQQNSRNWLDFSYLLQRKNSRYLWSQRLWQIHDSQDIGQENGVCSRVNSL